MNRLTHRLRLGANVAALVLVALSPFLVYKGFHLVRTEPTPAWPGDVALAARTGGDLRAFALVHFLPRDPVVIVFPAETLLQVPDMGLLRARTAFGIGGAGLLADGLGGTLGVDVPFAAEGPGAGVGASIDAPGKVRDALPTGLESGNLATHRGELDAILASARAGGVPVLAAPGTWTRDGDFRSFTPSVGGLRGTLADGSGPVTPSPSARASGVPAAALRGVVIEVLNAGGPPGSARDIAARLRGRGARVSRVANFTGGTVKGVLVYYAKSKVSGEAATRTIGGSAKLSSLPKGYRTTADVLVLVGKGAPAPSPSPSPSPSP